MEQKGRLTLPTDADVVEETLRLKNLLGADALRDCDGTEMPAELLQDPAKKYATYYTTRKDNAWAEANPDEVQQEYLISDRHTARGTKLRIHLMDGFHTQQLKVNTLDDPKRWWEVIDRTTGEVVPTDKWFFDEPTGEVEIETVPYHEYTVSFLAFLIHNTFRHNVSYDDLGGTISPASNPDARLEQNIFYVRDGVPFVRNHMDGGNYTESNDRIIPIEK